MKFILIALTLAATAIAGDSGEGKICKSGQSVVCSDNGNGLLTLGNIAPGALGDSCSGGDVYCCDDKDVASTNLINLDVNAQCSLNHLL